jgi:tetratricopeptide (TPR) repeat protein
VTPRVRVLALVGLAAVVAVGAVVGGTLLQTRGETTTVPGAVTKPRAGYPPLSLEFGVQAGTQTAALARAQTLYDDGKVAQAAAIFGRYRSLAAQIGSAFAAWKHDGYATMKTLAVAHPASALVQLHLGWADYWAGRNADAASAWQTAARIGRDSPYGVDALDALHPSLRIPGLPPIVTGLPLPQAVRGLPAARQLALLREEARTGGEDAKLRYGVALWDLRRPVSAERQLAAAAKLAPNDPLARVAAAVGLFTKANTTKAFAKLGPLTAVFPHSPVVEFHLGLLLLYIGEPAKGRTQLQAAVADGPQTVYAKNARVLLASLAKNGTK